jgi:putative FmdB family regulatory protein
VPLYEYECEKNGHRFELIRKFSDPPLKVCIYCKSKVRKLVSASAIAFKGTGWYVTDYGRKAGGESGKGESGKGESGKGESGKGEPSKSEAKPSGEGDKKSSKDSKGGKKKD